MTSHLAGDQDDIPALAVHPGDELVFIVLRRISGTTACSALDALSATSFVHMTIANAAGDTGRMTIPAGHAVHRHHANPGLEAA
jgi:hypothetical protein